ncbi:predicted protein [Naegleria gruberi]|uniref:Predicted protein n=1 Tax=Naegleria gruberi TaxID=5762 RepID=D2VVK5_NAEGR|nr:uncharacterized protein NAEGRDRAFT_81389 [Naegleria gruberi]EFC39127.1 predicted protein [Naegleria gruberi]|eukprot:XP_002671871.1 predicted protein [Naegleria gruberi strain NEG-M]
MSSQQTVSSVGISQPPVDGKIKPLSEEVINKIAAGEVIAAPSNAIKELLENSLDAGADSITIEFGDAGLKYFQITDNGCGIGAKDLEIVCERHTTSKLSSFEDLRSIATFGFRGEALSSVSTCAHVTITSKTEQQSTALFATYRDGKLTGPMKKRSGARGTIIRAENLFFDNKTRRESVNLNTEPKAIQKIVTAYALFNTGVSITLKKQGETKPIVHTLTKNNVRQNIKALFGPKIEKEIIEADINNEKIELTGKMYFTNVNYSSKEKAFTLFINNVNMHPTKKEVAVLDEDRIIEEVKDVLRKKLLGSNSSRTFEVSQKATPSKSFTPILPPNLINDDEDDAIIPTPSLTSPKLATQKELPKNKVRTSASDQTGQIHQYFPSLKRNFTEEEEEDEDAEISVSAQPVTKKRKENSQSKSPEAEHEENVDDLESLKSLRNSINAKNHAELEKLLRSSSYVGYINAKYSLVQFNDRVLAKFGRFKKINLKNSLDVKTILQGVSDNDEVIREALSVLNEKKEILQEYFSVCITEDLKLVSLPHVLENYIPPMHRVPDFLYALAFKVNWDSEIGCFSDVSTVISSFYNLCEDFELEDESENDSQKSSQEANANSTLYSKQRMRWITEHLVFPSIKLLFKPPESVVNDGSIVEVANLPELFKVFERC